MNLMPVVATVLALVLLGLFQIVIQARARKHNAAIMFMDLIITSDDKRYSLSRFQMYIWTVAVLVLWIGVSVGQGQLAEVENSLWLLMGFNAATAVAATGIAMKDKTQDVVNTGNQPQPTPIVVGPNVPNIAHASGPWFFRDIFLDSKNTLDLPRTQMFVWTVAILSFFILYTLRTFSTDAQGLCACHLEAIDPGLLGLMGVSQGGYIFVKAAEK